MSTSSLSRKSLLATAVIGLITTTGCVMQSATVSDDLLAQRAAFTLGVDQKTLSIANRMDEGETVRYQVLLNSGARFNCSIGRPPAMMGRPMGSVSDAICTAIGNNGTATNPAGSCNSLLKAAGKC